MSDEAIDFRSSKPRLGCFEQERAARPPRGRYEMLGRSVGLNSFPPVSHLHVRSYRASRLRSSYPCPPPCHTRVVCPLLVSATTRTLRADMVQYYILQRALEKAINRPDYTASLPPLSEKTWAKILTCTHSARAENERLEFVGDALMYATLAPRLYSQYPNGTPHLYTVRTSFTHGYMRPAKSHGRPSSACVQCCTPTRPSPCSPRSWISWP